MGREAAPDWVAARLDRSPIRRERKRYYKSLVDFHTKLKITYSVAYFTECGCYGIIPDTILKDFASKGTNTHSLRDEYREFQRTCRQEFGALYLPLLTGGDLRVILEKNKSTSFVDILMNELDFSQAELAKRLCVQTAQLFRLRTGAAKEFPQDLIIALRDTGVPSDLVRTWDAREGRR